MPDRRPVMAHERLSREIQVQNVRNLDRQRARYAIDTLGEIEQQFQIQITGTADNGLGWIEVELTFDTEFIAADDERLSNLVYPHFSFGAVIGSGDPVLVTAVVTEWEIDGRDLTTGCTVQIGVLNPAGPVDYAGYVHLTFQGFGAPPEGDPDL